MFNNDVITTIMEYLEWYLDTAEKQEASHPGVSMRKTGR